MAKYDVVYSCGHEGVLDLWGKRKQREWKIRNAQFLLCPECLEAERDQARKLAVKEAEELGLPKLKGSEKQVMELDEVIRLKQISGLKKAFQNHEFSKSWEEFESKYYPKGGEQ